MEWNKLHLQECSLSCEHVHRIKNGTERNGQNKKTDFSSSFTLKHCDAERSGAGNGERIKYCNFAMWKCFTLQHCDAERKCTNLQRSGAERGTVK
jgi:hypothetical protein